LLSVGHNFSLAATYFPVFGHRRNYARSMRMRSNQKSSLVALGAVFGVAAGLALTGCSGTASATGDAAAATRASHSASAPATRDTAAPGPAGTG
jgi:hypothetical protein